MSLHELAVRDSKQRIAYPSASPPSDCVRRVLELASSEFRAFSVQAGGNGKSIVSAVNRSHLRRCDGARSARGRRLGVALCLPSHGRGHWFDPSTAHQIKSGTYPIAVQTVEFRMAAGMADAKISSDRFRWIRLDMAICSRNLSGPPRAGLPRRGIAGRHCSALSGR